MQQNVECHKIYWNFFTHRVSKPSNSLLKFSPSALLPFHPSFFNPPRQKLFNGEKTENGSGKESFHQEIL
jgi:hypothetical protein